ncbi:hypothetical protein F4780DRAFT_738856 [Xylariomycetidae sp. FL0641]|nr:hypothetical protein F4780DRAFT_738856 [Xylariomycetidae sp. FL0641]
MKPESAASSAVRSIASSFASTLSQAPLEAGSSGGFAPPAWDAIQTSKTRALDSDAVWEDTSSDGCAAESDVGLSMSPIEVLPAGLPPVGCWVVAPGFTATTLDFTKRNDYRSRPKNHVSALSRRLRSMRSNSRARTNQPTGARSRTAERVTRACTRTASSSKKDESQLRTELEKDLAQNFEEWLEGLEGDYFRSHF